jgi:hypothetical protein
MTSEALDPIMLAAVDYQMQGDDRIRNGRPIKIPTMSSGGERTNDSLASRAAECVKTP